MTSPEPHAIGADDFAEMMKSHIAAGEEYARKREIYRNSVDPDATFCPEDLGDWIRLCEAARVPYVPATCVAEVSTSDVVMFDTEGPHTERVKPFWESVEQARGIMGHMIRWSNCSCAEVKYRLGNGEHEWSPEIQNSFGIEDFRAFDLVCDFPKPTIRAWLRPWLPFQIIDGYPLEFRVFVERNKIAGVSSYYPQRPLPVTWSILGRVQTVAGLAQKLINAQWRPLNMPEFARSGANMNENNWTADFAFTDGGALFLEGGPPHTPQWGAHPCCFAVGEIEGVALRPRVGMAGDVAEVIE